jgi:hypothetical protein
MKGVRVRPGPSAAAAFRTGIAAAALVGLAVVGLCYWLGVVDLVVAGYAVAVLFPIYLVVVAAALSVWLGYDKDATALRPVYREKG